MRKTILTAIVAAVAISAPLQAQAPGPRAVVSIYRAAPGQQVGLLQVLAKLDAIAVAAGQPAGQLYVHQDGASWDYVYIQPAQSPAQEQAFDAAARKMGIDPGPKLGIELRRYIAEHSDTIAAEPTTAADFLKKVAD